MQIKPVIIVCGKTGVGKSSLVQALTAIGTVPDSAISHSVPCTKGFVVYDTPVAKFIDAEGLEPGLMTIDEYADFILNEINNRDKTESITEVVTSVWYCIDAVGARVQENDAKLINKLASIGDKNSGRLRIIVTKSELLREKQMKEFDKALRAIVRPKQLFYVSSHRKDGLDTLNNNIEFFRNLLEEWMKRIDSETDSCIHLGIVVSAAIAVICPIPLVDGVLLMINDAVMIFRKGVICGFFKIKKILEIIYNIGEGLIGSKEVCGLPFTLTIRCLVSILPIVLIAIGYKMGISPLFLIIFYFFVRIIIGITMTYKVGKAAQADFKSRMTLTQEKLEEIYEEAKKEADKTEGSNREIKEE